MRGYVPVDPETEVSQERYAVIFTPRPSRKRFPAGCVNIVETAEAAIDLASSDDKRHAARVIGPSKSSEGQYIYYLVNWLEA
ncbi:MAG: hypothetical protein PVG75_12120 [Thioalkalispiraceae bacterium]|jgi:hypothetical protein